MDENVILLGHGSGGGLSHELIEGIFVRHFGNPLLLPLEDASVFPLRGGGRMAFTTDSYVVKPLFFPGGDIGRLSVCGTVNDLSMRGAEPLYLSAAFIIEEGFAVADLTRIVVSMAEAAREAGVSIVCGDTKVVERRAADGLFITTAGVGLVPDDAGVSIEHARPGDAVIVSGTMGDHGVTILSQRQGLHFKSPLRTDAAPLNRLVKDMLDASSRVHVMRDPTRGGIATTLKEIAAGSSVGIDIDEEAIPVSDAVRGACEMLGLDYLYLANEGKLVAAVPDADAGRVLDAMKGNVYGRQAAIIGHVTSEHPGIVTIRNAFGARRIVEMLASDQFPRIC
ncbi:MAG: hydrogenase expression/formation protein HypE [Syntrophorhabdales bacterium]|jgi:hydrogenase expression/formation protein HypE